MNAFIDILSTKELDENSLLTAREKGIRIDVSPFIRTEPVTSVEVQQEVESALIMQATVVFTSANAVEAVCAYITDAQPVWNMYCIGNNTASLAEDYFPMSKLKGKANNAHDLASLMLDADDFEEVLFFCGDMRRDELPAWLRQHDIEVIEVVVYQTISIPHKVSPHYKAVLFFSPSGVDSFFTMNKLTPETPVFAIGNTTARAVRKLCPNPVLIPDRPSREELVASVIDYYT